MKIGVLAMQGSYALHVKSLLACGVEPVLVKRSSHLEGLAGIILPGGESTTFHIVMSEDDLLERLKHSIANGLPTWGTCAGAIMLGYGEGRPQPRWNLINVEVIRNAYGRQLDSFIAPLKFKGIAGEVISGVFIRAPRFKIREQEDRRPRLSSGGVEVLAECDGQPVAARQGNIMVTAFHPELTDDLRVHDLFIRGIRTVSKHHR